MSNGGLRDIAKSPYDDNRDREEVPWKIPVTAAVVGALLMGLYVLFAVVSGPTEDSVDHGAEGGDQSEATAQGMFPVGYTEITPAVALQVDVATSTPDATSLYVSSVVAVDSDSGSIAPIDIATWTLQSPGGVAQTGTATQSALAPGSTTLEFAGPLGSSDSVLVASLPEVVAESSTVVSVDEIPFRLVNQEVVGDEFVVVIDELDVGLNGGWFRWSLKSGLVARVDIVVTVHLGGPEVRFTTPYNPTNLAGASIALPPTWATSGRSQLLGDFDGRDDAGGTVPDDITIDIVVSVVTELGDSFEIPMPSVVQR